MAVYGLIGETLCHSFSPMIHEKLGDMPYQLFPLKKEELGTFLTTRDFSGINVTIPYKKDVIPYCDVLTKRAEAIGAVNTIVNRNGELYGYNTDYDGFLSTLLRYRINVSGKVVLVLGTGGASQMVQAVLHTEGAKEVLVVSRMPSAQTISYAKAEGRQDVSVIVNATPVGMYPNVFKSPISLEHFSKLDAVVDLIYNPLSTELLQNAKTRGVLAVNGLWMLVSQAKASAELFLNSALPVKKAEQVYEELLFDKSNIVLIGMPMSGKTTIGQKIAKMLCRPFIDLDERVKAKTGMPVSEIFERFSEAKFRMLEKEAAQEASLQAGAVIATGGGTPLDPENVRNLRRNGILFYLDRPLSGLSVGEDRPLARSRKDIETLYRERYPIYQSAADFSIGQTKTPEEAAAQIIQKYREALCLPKDKEVSL